MLQSMTAFSRMQRHVAAAGQLIWEVRSVNHRYLDISFRLPDSFRFMETVFRSALREKIARGKLECQLKYINLNSDNSTMLINKGLVNTLVNLGEELAHAHQLANDLSVSHLLTWPNMIQMAEIDMDALGQQAQLLFHETIEQLVVARQNEGLALTNHIAQRMNALSDQVKQAKAIHSTLANQSKDKLLTRLQAINIEVMEGRIEQEIALLLSRLDVSEELDRLHTHLEEVGRILDKGGVMGKRLDFLMQELNREANTLSSKSDAIELTQGAIEMKVLIEQMREQIQNIE